MLSIRNIKLNLGLVEFIFKVNVVDGGARPESAIQLRWGNVAAQCELVMSVAPAMFSVAEN